MELRKMLCGLAIVALVLASVQTASASIIVQNTAFDTTGNAGFSGVTQTISGFALSGGTKLVVTTGTETANATGITFDGEPLTSIVSATDGVQQATIWYLDNPTALSGDIVVTYPAGNNKSAGIAALSISGTAPGVLDSSGAAGTNSGTLTIEAGSLVVGSFATNASSTLIDPGDPSTVIFTDEIWATSGGNAASAYFIEPEPATRTSFGFTGGSSSRPVAAAASFAAVVIPEPASAVLLLSGLAALLLPRRIRKQRRCN